MTRKFAHDLISDKEIDYVHGNADFGPTLTQREIVDQSLLKCACGYHNGFTAQTILAEHGLIVSARSKRLTTKGKIYLFAAYRRDS